ncbi:MAG: outer membrane protein assembly factor BamA [Aquificaceae bacterium]|nr:outer membrane protein assembly factor BamA [Aquificaceae bacterium]
MVKWKVVKGMWLSFRAFFLSLFLLSFSFAEVIDRIEIEGARYIPEDVILGIINLRQGSLYSTDIVRESIRRLYRTGFFDQVEVYQESSEGKVKLTYKVVDLPVIYKIEFEGNKKIRSEDLEKKIGIETEIGKIEPEEVLRDYTSSPAIEEKLEIQRKLRLGRVLAQEELETIKRRIVEAYVKEGYPNVQVSYKLVPKKGASKVVYTIEEGKPEYVRRIDFVGNKSFSGRRLLGIMETKPVSVLVLRFKPPYSEEVLKEDIKKLKDFYVSEGFLEVKVEYKVEKEEERYTITINIQEGPRYKLSELKLEGNTLFTYSELTREPMRKNKGGYYRKELVERVKANIKRKYSELGFLNVYVDEKVKVDTEGKKVSLLLSIEEGDPVYVNRIQVQGNYESRDYVVRRELRFQEGELANLKEMERSRSRILSHGYYQDVTLEPFPSEGKAWDFTVKVRERFTGQFSVGVAYNQVTGLSGFVSIRKGNFRGTGDVIGLSFSYGSRYRDNAFSYTKKWFLNKPMDLTGSVYEKRIEYSTYTVDRTGFDLTLSREFAEFWKVSGGFSLQRVKYSNISVLASPFVKEQEGERQSRKFILGIARDSRDNYLFPSQGSLSEVGYSLAVPALGGNERFNRITLSHQHFFKDDWFDTETILSLKGVLGLVEAYGGKKVPIDEKFFVGGDFTIRGYRYGYAGRLDPKTLDPIGSKKQFLFSTELNYPLHRNLVYGAVFYDTGLGFEKWEELKSQNLRGGYGFGIRFVTPIAPIKLDWAFKTKKVPGDTSKSKIHFVIGFFF